MKKTIYSTTGLVFLLLIGCSSGKQKNREPEQVVSVTVGASGSEDSLHHANASGKLVARNTVNISTRMMGYITGIHAEIGQQVHAGQLLVTINSTDLQARGGQASAQITQAQANYNSAKKDYERFSNLYESQSASRKELDDMRTRFETAKAALEAAQMMKREVNAQFSYSNITAPISGVVTAKTAKAGDMATPGMPLLTIEAPSSLQAQVMIPEEQVLQVHNGQKVNILVKSTGKQTNGVVSEISPSSTATGGLYLVKVDVSKDPGLLPGMYVNVEFSFKANKTTKANTENSITIPVSAITEQGQLKGIYTISSNNTAILRWIKTGKRTGTEVEVLSGLGAGEKYILQADGRLYNGVRVKIK
ncbi:MAG TPA: efflux RND transporter periplasmic adaptor subunit [Ferruginibacter sp.]|nr:efflux RND transporter periplasmic adaptor subunit [Chitinophagaceae bacterium]HRI25987.1 efflux RND transporter periplasmic adaptor subunit [Ferruginibacter sp.]